MPKKNIFRQAQELLKTKPIEEMSYEEVLIVKSATIALDILPQFNLKTADQGLEELARILEEAHKV